MIMLFGQRNSSYQSFIVQQDLKQSSCLGQMGIDLSQKDINCDFDSDCEDVDNAREFLLKDLVHSVQCFVVYDPLMFVVNIDI